MVRSMSSEVSIFSEHRLRVPEGVPRRFDESYDTKRHEIWECAERRVNVDGWPSHPRYAARMKKSHGRCFDVQHSTWSSKHADTNEIERLEIIERIL